MPPGPGEAVQAWRPDRSLTVSTSTVELLFGGGLSALLIVGFTLTVVSLNRRERALSRLSEDPRYAELVNRARDKVPQ